MHEVQSREDACDGAFNVVLEKTKSFKPKSNFHMNQKIDHIENFVLELKTFILGSNTQFGLYKDTKTIEESSKGGECMSSEVE